MNWLLLLALTSTAACASDPEDEFVWGVEMDRTMIAVGAMARASSLQQGPDPLELPTPVGVAWHLDPPDVVARLSLTNGSTVYITGVAPGTTTLVAERSTDETRMFTITVIP